jgi:hypothetical protein
LYFSFNLVPIKILWAFFLDFLKKIMFHFQHWFKISNEAFKPPWKTFFKLNSQLFSLSFHILAAWPLISRWCSVESDQFWAQISSDLHWTIIAVKHSPFHPLCSHRWLWYPFSYRKFVVSMDGRKINDWTRVNLNVKFFYLIPK